MSRIAPHTRTALTVLGICLLLNLIGRGTADNYVVFLRPLEQDLGWSRSEMTSVYSIYLLVNGLSSPVVGTLFIAGLPFWHVPELRDFHVRQPPRH